MSHRTYLVILLAGALPLCAALKKPVKTETGAVLGVTANGSSVTSFKGIPYAAPPVGDLRWKEPQPPAPWKDIRNADKFSPGCPQPKSGPFGPWSAEYIALSAIEGGASEDCLYLNVWTAASKAGEKRPVFVWIHGGGFMSGSGDVPVYDGEGLASKGLVMVTINYRLGVLGFLAHPDLTKESPRHASGNYALMDMIAALEWVRKNIAGFGGDPGNVTIAGQSAGAFAVNYLVASPLAKGLFQRAIAESGGAFMPAQSLKDAEAAGVKIAEKEGAKTIAEMRAKPITQLVKGFGQGGMMPPIIDGWVIPADVHSLFAEGRQNDVPVLTGWNDGDSVMLGPPPTAEKFREQARKNYGDLAGDFLKVFPASTDQEAAASARAASRDQMFAWQSREWARMQNKSGKSKIYLYVFDRTAPGAPEQVKYGAFHSGEIAYALNTLDMWKRPWEPADRKLSGQMSGHWVNFARTGNPNGAGLPEWPAYSPADERLLKLGEAVEAIAMPYKAELDFFDAFAASKRTP
jgi:para-nitrobenzyl esterase